jgi:hypothetical protein
MIVVAVVAINTDIIISIMVVMTFVLHGGDRSSHAMARHG